MSVKKTVLDWIDNIAITKDDDIAVAGIIYLYSGGPEDLYYLLASYDLVVTIDDPSTRGEAPVKGNPEQHTYSFPVHAYGIDNPTVTATRALAKFKTALDNLVDPISMSNVGYDIQILGGEPTMRYLGGHNLWERIFIVEYRGYG